MANRLGPPEWKSVAAPSVNPPRNWNDSCEDEVGGTRNSWKRMRCRFFFFSVLLSSYIVPSLHLITVGPYDSLPSLLSFFSFFICSFLFHLFLSFLPLSFSISFSPMHSSLQIIPSFFVLFSYFLLYFVLFFILYFLSPILSLFRPFLLLSSLPSHLSTLLIFFIFFLSSFQSSSLFSSFRRSVSLSQRRSRRCNPYFLQIKNRFFSSQSFVL